MTGWLKIAFLRCRSLFRSTKVECELDKEIQFHIDMLTQEKIEEGLDPQAARKQALSEFGHADFAKEECRDSWGTRLVFDFWRDARYAIHQLAKQKSYAITTIATLALAIGATTSVFSLINTILLQSLSVPNPHELRTLHWTGENPRIRAMSGRYFENNRERTTMGSVSHPMFLKFQEELSPIADVFGFTFIDNITLRANQQALTANGMLVSDNFFTALQVSPVVGRVFSSENSTTNETSIVITYDLWRNQFNEDVSAIGSSIVISAKSYTVIGVLPEGFKGIQRGSPRSFYLPIAIGSPFLSIPITEDWHWFVEMIARAKTGVSDEQISARLTALFSTGASEVMANPTMVAIPSSSGYLASRGNHDNTLFRIFGVVVMVLLVACANLAGLSLVRGTARQHELSIRSALGANKSRLILQSLTESIILSIIGGGIGILIANWGTITISRLFAGNNEGLLYDFSLNIKVLGFSIVITVLTALLSGLLPALRAGAADPLAGLKSRGTMDTPHLKAGKLLVVAQICISLALLAGASLYAQSLSNLNKIDAGFDTENLLVFQLNPHSAGREGDEIMDYYIRIQNKISSIPGVENSAFVQVPLLSNANFRNAFTYSHKLDSNSQNTAASAAYFDDRFGTTMSPLMVSDTFFETMGIPMLQGRGISGIDSIKSTKIVVINETFAKIFFQDENPIDHTLDTGGETWRIVGVCQDTKHSNIREPTPPVVYLPLQQVFDSRMTMMVNSGSFSVRSKLPPAGLTKAVQEAVASVDPNVPIFALTTQKELRDSNISQSILIAKLSGYLSALTLLLCCIGLYGLIAYNVKRRSSEIAVRLAIGAQPNSVSRMILRESLILATIGIALGLPAAYAVARYIKSQLYEVQPNDPTTLGVIIATLATIVLVATWIPARRASQTNPLAALRGE